MTVGIIMHKILWYDLFHGHKFFTEHFIFGHMIMTFVL